MPDNRPPETIAVLTGDLIGSSKVAPEALEKAMDLLAAAAGDIARWAPGKPNSAPRDPRFTRFRGDGWQMLVAPPALALRAALVLAARLRAADLEVATRVAIGIGPAGSLGGASLADARGPAFEASGRSLDHIGRTRRLAIDGEGIGGLHRVVLDLLDEIASHWTRQQAEAAALYLAPDAPTLEQIAPRLGISAQAVNYRLSGAGAAAIRRALRGWEEDLEAGDADA